MRHGKCASGCEVKLPAAFVNEVMVVITDRNQPVDIGEPTERVPVDMMNLAVVERHSVVSRSGAESFQNRNRG